jgi:uncharacterized coiled-coil protein SlyX
VCKSVPVFAFLGRNFMSVHQESLEINKTAEEAPELEYRTVSHDSLSMFLAAIGGAVLGMLLTLLILALINGGTLSFSGGERLAVFEATLERVNENVGAVSANVDTVSQHAQSLTEQLATIEGSLRAEMAAQGTEMEGINQAVTQLDQTRQQFDLFIGALGQAMTAMQELQATAVEPAETAPQPSAAVAEPVEAVELPAPTVVDSADVAPDAISVVLFVDANVDGVLDEDETSVTGASIALLDAEGNAIASEMSSENGVVFVELPAGAYTVSVEDAAGYELLSQGETAVEVAEGAEEGQAVYVALGAE